MPARPSESPSLKWKSSTLDYKNVKGLLILMSHELVKDVTGKMQKGIYTLGVDEHETLKLSESMGRVLGHKGSI